MHTGRHSEERVREREKELFVVPCIGQVDKLLPSVIWYEGYCILIVLPAVPIPAFPKPAAPVLAVAPVLYV